MRIKKGPFRWLAVLIGLCALPILPALTMAGNLLTNGNFESFSTIGRTWRGVDEKVGTGWNHFYIASGTELDRLHWFSSQDFAEAFEGLNYKLERSYAQNMWSAYEFDAGIYQRVTGLTPGTAYAFDVPIVTFWRGPGHPVSDEIMEKRIGIDPLGGTDPTSPDVVWSEVNSDDKAWVYMDLAARAESEAMTFFVRIQAPENSSDYHTDLDMVYIDVAKVDLAPTVSLNVPTTSDTNVTFSWIGSAAPGWSLKGVEVQYRDEADGEWTAAQGKAGSGDSSHSFLGQPGHVYIVRARPWQTMAETYNADIDMPGLWIEKSVTVGGAFYGYVRNNFGAGVSGAVISVTGGNTASGPAGFYALEPLSYGESYTLTVSASDYKSPPPIRAAVPDQNSVTPITFTLKPANDAIVNGDFESNTYGWSTLGSGSAGAFSGDHRSGDASLELTGHITLTQTVAIADFYNPNLSFWHKPALSQGDRFQVRLGEGSTVLASKSFTVANVAEWQHTWLSLNRPEQYTGSLTISFQLAGGQVFLDEVSLGGGPHTTFLPVVLRSATP